MPNDFLTPPPAGAFRRLAPLVLASGSPRRRELLASLGLDFAILPSSAGEPRPASGEAPAAYARRMALLKARDVAARRPECAVLGADTIVVPPTDAGPERILGKPKDAADARRMLTLLSGRTHGVVTGVCLIAPGAPEPALLAVTTEVAMRASSQAELFAYVATGEPMDKAGAYAIQGLGAFLVERVNGSYTNVVGLPVAECAALLLRRNVIAARREGAATPII